MTNTYPASQDFSAITNGPSSLSLNTLSQLDTVPGNCSYAQFDSCDVYLTSKTNVSTNPSWLYGVPPSSTYKTTGATSAAIIMHDHGDGTVDAYYMYFYAFNYGDVVLGQVLGDHVGDWEHTMLRFVNGQPTAMWFSIHDYGECYTYDAVSKSGGRPIVYSALGSHGNHPVPGEYSRTIGLQVNDYMSAGALWDPTLSAYYYSYNPSSSPTSGSTASILTGSGTFTPTSSDTPTDWLYFLGRWGDQRYPDSDPRQVNFLNLNETYKWETGPTGPLDKQLSRADVCPSAAGSSCVTTSTLPPVTSLAAATSAVISVPTTFTGIKTNALGAGTGAIGGATASSTGTAAVSSAASASATSTSTSLGARAADDAHNLCKLLVSLGFVALLFT